MMKPAEHITSVLRPYLDEERRIDIAKAEEILRSSDFKLDDFDPEGEGLAKILGDMSLSFRIQRVQDTTYLECLLDDNEEETKEPSPATDGTEPPTITDPPFPDSLIPEAPQPTNTAELNAKIADIIRLVAAKKTDRPYPESKALLTEVGAMMRAKGLSVPQPYKLSKYIKTQSKYFELTGDGESGKYYVRNICDARGGKEPEPTTPPTVNKYEQPSAVQTASSQQHVACVYELLDFAYFEDYVGALRQLANITTPVGWHLLPADNNSNPYLLLGYRLRTQFALGVEELLRGSAKAPITLGMNGASFRTGFATADGRPVCATFAYNTLRDGMRWQQYVFVGFTAE